MRKFINFIENRLTTTDIVPARVLNRKKSEEIERMGQKITRCAGTHVFFKVVSLVGMPRKPFAFFFLHKSPPLIFLRLGEEGRVKHRGPEIFHGNMEPNTKRGEEAQRSRKSKKRMEHQKIQAEEQVPMKRVPFQTRLEKKCFSSWLLNWNT